ncbi:MAG: hypothetical protein OXI87_24790 [Albidovulum sp.]|nr:hypothetical protein [Albidovulum sp.]
MKKQMILALTSLSILSACMSADDMRPTQLTQPQIDIVHQGVKDGLIDPNSAILGNPVAAYDKSNPQNIRVCGLVNAKNRFGGYTGNQWYYGDLVSNRFELIDFNADGNVFTHARLCPFG